MKTSNKKILSKVVKSKVTTNFVAKLCPYNISLFLPSLPPGKFKYDKLVGYNSISIDQTGQISRFNLFACAHIYMQREHLQHSLKETAERERESYSKTHHLWMPHPSPFLIAYLACISAAQQEASKINYKSIKISFHHKLFLLSFATSQVRRILIIKITKTNLEMTL